MAEFPSEILKEPKLKFGRDTIEEDPLKGLRDGGPYDISIISKDEFNALLLYSKQEEKFVNTLILRLQEGEFPFSGFYNLFKRTLLIDKTPISYDKFEEEIQNIIKEQRDKDIIFVILPNNLPKDKKDEIYFKGKLLLSSQGMPSQFLSANKINEVIEKGSLGYYLQNLSLSIYAKIGRKPWVLHRTESVGSDIILGVGGTRINGRNYFAFTTLFERNGAFDWWSADIPNDPENDVEYIELLKNQIITAIKDFKRQNPDYSIERISFHISGKRPGKLEKLAITKAMKDLSEVFKYGIFHINTTSPLWIMNENNGLNFYHPPKGLKVKLSSKDFLIVTDEPKRNPRAPIGPTRVTLIEHNFKDEEFKNVHMMVKEVYYLTRMNWRGFRAKNVPVSVYYPRLIAWFLEKFKRYDDGNYLNTLRSNLPLKTRAWFL
jgi:argonaute family protein